MSYANMDHAEWVQHQIGPSKLRLRPAERRKTNGWAAAPEQISVFHAKVFDILGIVFGGIYNAPITWATVEWNYSTGIGVPIRNQGLATYDFMELTSLVFLAHEARIRASVEPHGMNGIMLLFFPRKHDGGMSRQHPNLDEAVAAFRKNMPATHRIFYTEPDDGMKLDPAGTVGP